MGSFYGCRWPTGYRHPAGPVESYSGKQKDLAIMVNFFCSLRVYLPLSLLRGF
jgi:hypothetical protein